MVVKTATATSTDVLKYLLRNLDLTFHEEDQGIVGDRVHHNWETQKREKLL